MYLQVISLLREFWTDLINVKLIKAKFLWFTTLFSIVILYPFLSLHMTEDLGLSERDVGIVSSLNSVIKIISPFFLGFVADKIGNFKFFLSGITFLCGVLALLFTVIPPVTSSASLTEGNNYTEYDTALVSTNITDNGTIDKVTFIHLENDDYATTFWSYLIIRTFFSFLVGGGYTLFEGAFMGFMQQDNLDYGKQRAWGTLAVGISPMVGGKLNDIYGMSVTFCVSAAFYFITAAGLLFFDLEFKKPAKNLFRDIYSQIFNAEIIMLLLIYTAVGALTGYIETFLYIYLNNMGASNTLIGLTITAGVPFEIIIQIFATPITAKIGYINSLVIGLFCYAIRTVGLSLLTNPWWVLPFEILESVTGGLLMTAALMYLTDLVTLSSVASFRGLMGICNYGIGKLLGVSIGTVIRSHIGDAGTLIVMSVYSLVIAIIYLVAYKIYKKYQEKNSSTVNKTTEGVIPEKQIKVKEIENGIDNPALVEN